MERDNNVFFDPSSLTETPGIRQRADAAFLQNALGDPDLKVTSVSVNETGVYKRPLGKITGLPPYVEVRLRHRTGVHEENLIVWSPLCWNDRFMGTGGGGTGTGGAQYITCPDNTSRGQTLPKAILNGFTAATTDAGNGKRQWAVENGVFDRERYENWRSRSTHRMTVIGKRVAEILHEGHPDWTHVEWAIRFALGTEGLITMLSGMSSLEQMEQNIATWKAWEPLNADEAAVLDRARAKLDEMLDNPCTNCQYCMKACPKDIKIAPVMEALNRRGMYGDANGKNWYGFQTSNGGKASECIQCFSCEAACPQHIEIVGKLEKAVELFE